MTSSLFSCLLLKNLPLFPAHCMCQTCSHYLIQSSQPVVLSRLYPQGSIKEPKLLVSHPQWSEGWGLHSNACLSQSQSSVFSFSQPSLCSHRTMVKCLLLCQKCVCLSHFLNACFFHFLSMFPNPSFQRCYSNLIEML